MVSTTKFSLSSFFTTENLNRFIIACLYFMVFCSTFSIALTQIAYYSALIVWLSLIIRKKEKFQSTPLDLWFILYLVIEVITTIFSLNRIDALLHIQKRLLLLPIVYLVFRYINTQQKISKLITTLFISASVVGIISSSSILIQFSEYAHYVKRFNIYNHYMTIGGLSMFMLLMMTPFVLNSKTSITHRIVLIIGISSILFTLLFTFTRSAWVGLIAGVIILTLLRYKKLVYLFLIIVVGVMVFGSTELHERFTSILNPSNSTNAERLTVWSAGFRIFLDHPFFGVGDISLERLTETYTNNALSYGHMHNNLMMWLVTLGSVGFIVVVLWFIKIWKLFWSAYRDTKNHWFFGSLTSGAIAVFIGFQVNGFFEWNFGDAEIYTLFWIVVGLILAVNRLKNQDGSTALVR